MSPRSRIAVSSGRPIRRVLARVHADPMVRNSFFLVLTTATTALMGFLFWLVVARTYPVADVGHATSLMSAVALLSYFSLIGFSFSLIRLLPTARHPARHISTALIAVAGAGVLAATIFLVVVPVAAPEMAFVTSSWSSIAVFVVLATCTALNLLTDSVFIAFRAARFNFLINGLLMGVVKIALPRFFLPFGAIGVFSAAGTASAAAAVASIIVITRRLGIALRPRFDVGVLRTSLPYSMGNYVTSCLNLVPLLVLPVIVLQRDGPAEAAGYFIAFQVATVINAISFAVGESLLAEASHAGSRLTQLMRRSATIMGASLLPAVGIVILLAGPVLRTFGDVYAATATSTLTVLTISAFAVAFHTWAGFLLKVTGQLRAMIAAEAVFAAVTTALAALAAGYGTTWVAAAWGVGNLLSGVVAAAALRTRGSTTSARGGTS